MNRSEWSDFLSAWQDEAMLLVSLIPDHVLDQQARADLFPSNPMKAPATDHEISVAQSRLECDIPDELSHFFLASNGWLQYGFDEHDLEVLPVSGIYYLANADRQLREGVSGYTESVGEGARRNFFRGSDLGKAAFLSDHKSGCYLVNLAGPFAGECAVVRWQSAPQLFASFSDLMVSEKNRCLDGLRSMLD